MTKAVILGTGSCLPERILTNTDLERMVETTDEWIASRTGIRNRRIAGKNEQNYQLATKAARRALAVTGIDVIPEEKVFINLSDYGNTSAASIPIALDEAHRLGRLVRGDIVLLCTFGGGLTWGSLLMRW